MISTSVKPVRFDESFVNISLSFLSLLLLLFINARCEMGSFPSLLTTHSLPLPLRGNDRRMNR